LIKIVIPARLKVEFLARLHGLNVTPAALFPGLDGLGRMVRDYVQCAAVFGKT